MFLIQGLNPGVLQTEGKLFTIYIWLVSPALKFYAVSLLYPWVLHLQVHSTTKQKLLKKIPGSSKKKNLTLLHADNYLNSIYIVLGFVSNVC